MFSRFKKVFRRPLVRLCGFFAFVLVTVTAAGAYGYTIAVNYRTQIESAYQSAIKELNEYLEKFRLPSNLAPGNTNSQAK